VPRALHNHRRRVGVPGYVETGLTCKEAARPLARVCESIGRSGLRTAAQGGQATPRSKTEHSAATRRHEGLFIYPRRALRAAVRRPPAVYRCGDENTDVGFRTSFARGSRYGSAEIGMEQTMAQGLIFWVATASVGMGMGVLFVVVVALKQLAADDDPD
jgi:hypothetical protein